MDHERNFRGRRSTLGSATGLAEPASGYSSPKLVGRYDGRIGGQGLFAREAVRKGEVLVVWGGEVVTAERLELLDADTRHRLCLQVEEGLFLLTTSEGPADWVNHSCDPNSGLLGQIVLVAMRDIAPGEEICFDYAMTDTFPYDEFDCRCGTPVCRGRIRSGDFKIPSIRRRYRGFFAPHVERALTD